MAAFAIDVGGTAIKLGVVLADGSLFRRTKIPFDRDESFDDLCARIVVALREMQDREGEPVERLAISVPGFPEPGTGVMLDGCNNVPALKGNSLSQALGEALGLESYICNDGVAAALGEANFGSGKGVKRFVLLTLGTGVGGAVVIDGQPLQFADGCPAELGAIPVGTPELGGREHALEYQACASAFMRAADGCAATLEELFDKARAGDAKALDAVSSVARVIAQALSGLVNAIALETCIIGGGISGAGEFLTSLIQQHMADFVWPYLYARVNVRTAILGNDAGMLGATTLTSVH